VNRTGTIELTGEVNDRLVVHPFGEELHQEMKRHAMENLEAAAMKRIRDKTNTSPDAGSSNVARS
jgi:hypothetical protein